MIGVAICGVGNIGRVHLANLQQTRGCRLVGVFDTRTGLDLPSGVRQYANVAAMLADQAVELVVIATPPDSHRELTLRSLAQGKHVFVEKPLAATLADAEAIFEASRDTSQRIQVGFCERSNPQYIEAHRAVQQGLLGRIRAIHSSRVAPYGLGNPHWELGIFDTAVHNFDLILWMMSTPPESVLSRGVQLYSQSRIPHTATTILKWSDGAIATDQITWLDDRQHPLSQCARSRMHLIGEGGSFEVDLTARPSTLLTRDSFQGVDTVLIGGAGYAACLKAQFDSLLSSIEERTPVVASVADALLAERVALAAQRSLLSGAEVHL